MYPMDTWNALSEKISKLNDFDPKNRAFKRLFLNGANVVEVDSAGRMLLSKPQLEYAGIKKDMILSAQANKVELWDKDTYYNYLKDNADGFSDLAAEVAGGSSFNPFAD
jgi:MraZ protein